MRLEGDLSVKLRQEVSFQVSVESEIDVWTLSMPRNKQIVTLQRLKFNTKNSISSINNLNENYVFVCSRDERNCFWLVSSITVISG